MNKIIGHWRSRLEFANKGRIFVRHEHLQHLNLPKRFRILYVSDLHLCGVFTEGICFEIVNITKNDKPDLVLLGGDLVDNRRGLPYLRDMIASIAKQCLVATVSGNHDDYVGHPLVRKSVEEAGGVWLESEMLQINSYNRTIAILGDVSQSSREKDFQILCTHNPNVFPKAAEYGIDVVFAGHLHGSQVVFFQKDDRLYPGAFFYRWNGLRFSIGKSKMFVSRGVADTLPVRWNCPREVIRCDLE